jgi:O-antigen ligase
MISIAKPSRDDISFALLLTALLFLPFSKTVCHAALIIYFLSWLKEGNWETKVSIVKTNRLLQLMLSLSCVIIIGWAYTEDWESIKTSLSKNIFLFIIPLCIATSSSCFTRKQIRILFYAFSCVCTGALLFAFFMAWKQYEFFQTENIPFQRFDFLNSSSFFENNPTIEKEWAFFTYVGLGKAIHLHPTYFSLYLSCCLLFILSDISLTEPFNKKLLLKIALMIFLAVGIVLLSARIIISTLFIVLLTMVVYQVKQFTLKKMIVSSVLLVAFFAAVFSNPISRYRNWEEVISTPLTIVENRVYQNSTEIRASLWWLSWKSYTNSNLVFGAGSGDVLKTMKETSTAYKISNILGTVDPHSQFLYFLIGNGLIGLIVFIACLAKSIMNALHAQDFFLLSFVFVFTMVSLTESVLELQKGIIFFTIIFPVLNFHRQSFIVETANKRFAHA